MATHTATDTRTASETHDAPAELQRTVRAGVFSTLEAADRAVGALLSAGFSKEQITVLCSDKTVERHFGEFDHQEPAGKIAGDAAVAGTSVGAILGGLTAIAVGAATGAVPLVIAGGAGIAAGSAAGGFVGAMATRAFEKELSNFYDQELTAGQILVGVQVDPERDGPGSREKLLIAEKIIADAGANPTPLPEG